ncbi:hypothetical protein N665_0214s0067 [Sinapis alba]|nr:hypothetical protein N665_0214s0067 [Sinapis alba]
MNLLICFVLVLVGTTYSRNHVEIHNQLGPGIVLYYQCRETNLESVDEKEQLQFNKSRIFDYDKYYHDVRVYREATFRRSGILRSWEARKDGIYFKTRQNRP